MSDWLHSLPVAWMALLVFGATYLLAAAIYAVVTLLEGQNLGSKRSTSRSGGRLGAPSDGGDRHRHYWRARRQSGNDNNPNRCIRLATATVPNIVTPVALPPGRLRLATKPSLTGSPLEANTIGIVRVAAATICGEGSPPECGDHCDLSAYQIGC